MKNNSINTDRIIYELSVQDILTVIEEEDLDIDLQVEDIDLIEEKVAEYIDWHAAISNALADLKNNPIKTA